MFPCRSPCSSKTGRFAGGGTPPTKAQAEQQSTYLRHRGQLLQTFERFNNTREEAESLRLQVLPAASNAYELASRATSWANSTFSTFWMRSAACFKSRPAICA